MEPMTTRIRISTGIKNFEFESFSENDIGGSSFGLKLLATFE